MSALLHFNRGGRQVHPRTKVTVWGTGTQAQLISGRALPDQQGAPRLTWLSQAMWLGFAGNCPAISQPGLPSGSSSRPQTVPTGQSVPASSVDSWVPRGWLSLDRVELWSLECLTL